MIETSENLWVQIQGDGIHPGTISASDLAVVLSSLEKSVIPVVLVDHPGVRREDVFLGLVEVTSKSVGLGFRPSDRQLIVPAIEKWATAFDSGDFSDLPRECFDASTQLVRLAKDRRYRLGLGLNGTRLLQIHADTRISRDIKHLKGSTVLYGTLEDVGGLEPRIVLRLDDGRRLSVKVNKERATEIATRLYSRVGLSGVATWDRGEKSLMDFQVTGIEPYKETPIRKAIARVGELLSPYYADVSDVTRYVDEMRR